MQYSSPVSGDRKCQILTVWFLLLDDEPISRSHFSSVLHILPLKQYKGLISMKSMKTQIFLQKNACGLAIFLKFLTSMVIQ